MKRLLVAVFAVAMGLATSVPAFAEEDQGNRGYLALGDSVAFGYRPPDSAPTPNYTNAASFVGYPEMVAAATELRDSNASCSGEATGGVNDVFHCQNVPSSCPGGIPQVLATNFVNLSAIFKALRATGYRGAIVALTYYSLAYDPASVAATQGLNQPMIAAASHYNVKIADGLAAFQPLASQAPGMSTCAAGLTIRTPAGRCDVHPTALGHALLARAVLKVLEED